VTQLIHPPNQLIDKTGSPVPGLGGVVLRRAADAAKRHIAKVDYCKIVQPSLERIDMHLGQLKTNPASTDAARRIFDVAHDLRGEGGSFGYPAVSNIATLICKVTEEPERTHPRRLTVVTVHIDSLKAMVRYNVKGDPNGTALEIISALATLVDLYLGPWAMLH
jgi:hypothetical protein